MSALYDHLKAKDEIEFLNAKAKQARDYVENGYMPHIAQNSETVIGLIRAINSRIDSAIDSTCETESEYMNEGIDIDASAIKDELFELARVFSRLATLLGVPPLAFSKTISPEEARNL